MQLHLFLAMCRHDEKAASGHMTQLRSDGVPVAQLNMRTFERSTKWEVDRFNIYQMNTESTPKQPLQSVQPL